MHLKPVIPALLIASMTALCASPCLAQTAPATTSQPASKPAIEANSPQGAMQAMLRALFQNDYKALMETLALADDADRAAAEAIWGNAIADQLFNKALIDTFGKDAGDENPAVDTADKMAAGTSPKVNGDSAELVAPWGKSWYAIKKDGQWKVDFHKTIASLVGEFFIKESVAHDAAEGKIIKDVTADVLAKKYKSAAEAKAEREKRAAALPDPTAATATAPAK